MLLAWLQMRNTAAGKRIVRVALGSHSNKRCVVHPAFRCIVLMDESKVASADPPFLNRRASRTSAARPWRARAIDARLCRFAQARTGSAGVPQVIAGA